MRGTSCQPVNRFSRFHVLCPCRSRTRMPTNLAMAVHRRGHVDNLGELLGVEAGATDQAAVAKRQLDVRLDVAGVDAASIEDAHLPGRAGADQLTDDAADRPHGRVWVLAVRAVAAADR